jgi:hypothetical protein
MLFLQFAARAENDRIQRSHDLLRRLLLRLLGPLDQQPLQFRQLLGAGECRSLPGKYDITLVIAPEFGSESGLNETRSLPPKGIGIKAGRSPEPEKL